jgi:hypothetical protein
MIHFGKVLGKNQKFYVAMSDSNPEEYAFEDAAQRRVVFEYDGVRFAITAKPDGILEYHGGDLESRLLFEYKTKATGIRPMNGKLDYKGPDAGHLRQVTAESLVFGIRQGIILYESTQKPSWFSDEDNSNVTKGQKTWQDGNPISDIRPFYFNITDEMQESLLADLARQAKLVYDKQKPKVTVECVQSCGFCPYFGGHCQLSLSEENLAELQEIERKYSNSRLAGKVEHRNLVKYLEAIG